MCRSTPSEIVIECLSILLANRTSPSATRRHDARAHARNFHCVLKFFTRFLLIVRMTLYISALRFLRYVGLLRVVSQAIEPACDAGSVLPFGSSGKSLSHQLSEQRLYIFTSILYKLSTSRTRHQRQGVASFFSCVINTQVT